MTDSTPTNEQTSTEPVAETVGTDELGQMTRQRDEYFDQLQRTRAEFINYQKRAKTQADSDRLFLIKPLALDILNALDNFDRAIESARSGGNASIAEGLLMVEKQFVGALTKHGVEPISALGQPFDPNFHEAIMQQPDAFHPEGTVVLELAKGYQLHGRVLRPTKVAVSIPSAG